MSPRRYPHRSSAARSPFRRSYPLRHPLCRRSFPGSCPQARDRNASFQERGAARPSREGRRSIARRRGAAARNRKGGFRPAPGAAASASTLLASWRFHALCWASTPIRRKNSSRQTCIGTMTRSTSMPSALSFARLFASAAWASSIAACGKGPASSLAVPESSLSKRVVTAALRSDRPRRRRPHCASSWRAHGRVTGEALSSST